ncbi:DUF2303 family protein [Salinicola sp. JS01]|uniref:DUF2303 family protein n=1 Tax=Salinicola sp. JS01 TaxID=3050071 RepID=UPI00255B8AB5|nr:DUF2303 family protein [Salinicola sp. JS01]WIX34116.1 DUF2303 family protein [Salinicola sp. JS01]
MDAEAIQKIQELTHAAAIGNPGTDVPSILVPSGFKLQSLEPLMTSPTRFRGTFATTSLEDYAEYINAEHGGRVFVDTESMRARAFFDLGDVTAPGHGEHTAALTLEKTAAYAAMLDADGKAFAQKDLAHWVEDWHANIEGEDSNGNSLSPMQLAAAVRRIEIKASSERTHEEGDWNSSRSGLDQLDARSGDATPAIIRFSCTPYEALSQRTFTLRVSILTDDSKPRLKLRVSGLGADQELIAQEFKHVLGQHLADGATLLLGTFAKS